MSSGYDKNGVLKFVGELKKTSTNTSEPIFSQDEWDKVQAAHTKDSVVIYARESNHTGADEALERQKEKLKTFCEQKGYLIADEVATVGSREDSLSALKQAIESAKNTEGKTLLMASTNRVVGTQKEVTEIAELVEKTGVTIATMDGSYEYVKNFGSSPYTLIYHTLAATDDEVSDDE